MDQLRRTPRIPLHAQMLVTDILTSDGELIHRNYLLPLEDISVGGLSFDSKFPLPVGTLLHLRFPIGEESVRCVARVVRNQRIATGHYRIGCSADQISSADKQKLAHYLEPGSSPWKCPSCACLGCYNREKCGACAGEACYRQKCPQRFPYQT